MSIVGFNFTKIYSEKKAPIAGQVTINHKTILTDAQIDEVTLGIVKQKIIRVLFTFNIEYQPNLATIEFQGEVLWLESAEAITELEQSWKKDKKLTEPTMGQLMYNIISKCNIQALFLSRELNLPPPIPIMPQQATTPETTNKSKKK